MAPSTIRKALGAVKDQTSISIAKVSSTNSLSDLDVAILKATRHEEHPADERYVREILSLTCYSRVYISFCVSTLSKRLNKTKNWTVALKTLMLIHRLLTEGDSAYEQEIFFATRRGTRLLNLSDFRDTSRSESWDFSAFVRTYARYLDEQLEFRMHGRRGKHATRVEDEDEEEEEAGTASTRRATPVREMKTERIFTRIQHLQQLLERFLACRPTGATKNNRVVIVALYPIVKESFQVYYDITEVMSILIDRFMELEIPDCVKVHDIFTRIAKQFDELDMIYNWCKSEGIARSSEYPEVEKIAPKKLELMDEFIRDKSALARNKRTSMNQELKIEVVSVDKQQVVEEDMNAIKALPPPEGFCEVVEEKEEMTQEENKEKKNYTQQEEKEVDLLNLRDGEETSEEQGNKLALALFDGDATTTTTTTTWEAFTSEGSEDWETALVQSQGHLNNQKAVLGGGFDMLLLDGMYQQSAVLAVSGASRATGSASSVALGSAGKPAAMLALPAPPVSGGGIAMAGTDPFAASISVAPPTYVQMSEMEKKQKLLVEEQLMWQQYARDGMQGNFRVQQNPYAM